MMSNWIYPTAFSSWGTEERDAITRVRKSNQYTVGKEVEAFEYEFATYHNRKYAVMTNSGSSANLVAAWAFNHGSYKSNIGTVPAIAWSTTYAPFYQLSKRFMVSDIDDTWNANNTFMMRQPGFLVGCSVLGNPGYLKELRTAADTLKAPFLEDNCESLGAMTPEGKLTGTYGDISTFSFFYSHQISAIEGGMILTDKKELYDLCKVLSDHGNAGWDETAFDKKYNFTHFGYNVRGLELHAAIAREQLKKLPIFINQRWLNHLTFWNLAKGLPIKRPAVLPEAKPSPFGIAFEVLPGKEARAKLAAALRSGGIDCRPPTGGSFLKHAYGAPFRSQRTPNADRIHDTGMFIGLAPYSIESLLERAVKVIRSTL